MKLPLLLGVFCRWETETQEDEGQIYLLIWHLGFRICHVNEVRINVMGSTGLFESYLCISMHRQQISGRCKVPFVNLKEHKLAFAYHVPWFCSFYQSSSFRMKSGFHSSRGLPLMCSEQWKKQGCRWKMVGRGCLQDQWKKKGCEELMGAPLCLPFLVISSRIPTW